MALFAATKGEAASAAPAGPLGLYVAPGGNDAWSGRGARPARTDGPFASLERARDEIRGLRAAGQVPPGGVLVEVAAGDYERRAPFALVEADSGTPGSPVVYRAAGGGPARLLGGRVIGGFAPVRDPDVLGRLDEPARGQVLQTDLRAQGIDEFGSAAGSGLELFYGGRPMTLARWPNEGFVQIADVASIDPVDVRGTKGDRGGRLHYAGDRPARWLPETDLWLHGYWFWDWSDQRMKVDAIDLSEHAISLLPPQHGYGYRKGQWYYAFNALSELDAPGEWYLDRDTGILYFYPPAPVDEAETLVSVIAHLITMEKVAYVDVQGFTLEAARDTSVVLNGCTQVRLLGCTIRNVGGDAVTVTGGCECGVVGCDLYQMGKGGVTLDAGDLRTLAPGHHYADNNHVHDYARWHRMYHGAFRVNGVGNRVAHNLIHDAPHTAVFFGGNDHRIEFNEIHSVCLESNDAGAIYAGRNWTMRGTQVRYNYLHHINGFQGRGCVGIYLDDMYCGTAVYGNICYRVTMAAFIGGGRDNTIENNVFVECQPSLHVDARAMGWAKYHADEWIEELKERRTHLGIALLVPPYLDRYPELNTLVTGNAFAPEGNVIRRNIHWGGQWETSIEAIARPLLAMADNLVDEDPRFVDAGRLDFRLRDDSPAHRLGFQPIPVEEIGLIPDATRASWPVRHAPHEVHPPDEPGTPQG